MTGRVMLSMAAIDGARRPTIGRAVGLRMSGESAVRIGISSRKWPRIVSNIRETGQLALVCCDPTDYTTYQLKGLATIFPADDADLAMQERYWEQMRSVMVSLGVRRDHADIWVDGSDLVAAELQVREIYVQTPGPRAGASL